MKEIKLFLILTQNCNFACVYCEAHKYPHDMTPAVIRRFCELVVESADSFEKIRIYFFGGEPLLKFDLICQTVDFFKKNNNIKDKISLSLITNGSLLNKKIAAYLRKNNIDIDLSFDGAPQTQNYNRPFKNSFKSSCSAIINNLKFLDLKYWGRTHITVLLTYYPITTPFLYKDFLFLLKKGFTNFNFSPAISGKNLWHWNNKNLKILARAFKKIKNIIEKLKKSGFGTNLPPIKESYYADLAEWVGNKNIGIDIDGTIYSTDSFLILAPKERQVLELGNIFKEKDFAMIYKKRKYPKFIARALTQNGRYLKLCNLALKSLAIRNKFLYGKNKNKKSQ